MKNLKKPSFIIGLISLVVCSIALLLMANDYPNGMWVMYAGLAMGIIYWIWTIIEVSTAGNDELKKYQKSFWLILVICIPVFGSLLYHFAHQRRRKIAT
ncbi:MAG: PLDc N-terminal domain-containing protein [Chitinophagaceae bacterium]|nr:PLDc N-terminal domain-containing protein [Chitinophagaceae bacterium]